MKENSSIIIGDQHLQLHFAAVLQTALSEKTAYRGCNQLIQPKSRSFYFQHSAVTLNIPMRLSSPAYIIFPVMMEIIKNVIEDIKNIISIRFTE